MCRSSCLYLCHKVVPTIVTELWIICLLAFLQIKVRWAACRQNITVPKWVLCWYRDVWKNALLGRFLTYWVKIKLCYSACLADANVKVLRLPIEPPIKEILVCSFCLVAKVWRYCKTLVLIRLHVSTVRDEITFIVKQT